MYVIHSLRLNKFKPQPFVTPRRLFDKFGFSKPEVISKQTAENVEAVIPAAASKTQILALGQEIAAKAAEFKAEPSKTAPLGRIKVNEL